MPKTAERLGFHCFCWSKEAMLAYTGNRIIAPKKICQMLTN